LEESKVTMKEKLPEIAPAATTEKFGTLGGLVQSPALNSEGEPTRRAVRDVGMAQNILSTLSAANSDRHTVASRIMAKYNAERPYNTQKLKEDGMAWRSNFTTKPLAQMIEKVAPRFVESVQGLKYLTNSQLSAEKFANAAEKSEKFQSRVTKLIRGKKGWVTLVEDISLDNALFGYTLAACLDQFSWFPQHFSFEEVFIPDGTKQHASKAQVAVLKEVYLPHELYEYIQDAEAAEAVGWNVPEAIEAINKASPAQLRDQLTSSTTQEIWYQHAQRELTVGASYIAGASVINIYTLLVREVTGKISHYRLSGDVAAPNKSILIFEHPDRFNSMEDCMVFFSLQKGNKRLHGSKGIGRDIYELAGMQDRMRNEVVDRGILSGKTFVQGDFKQLHRFRMSVVGAMVIVPTGWNFIEQKVDGNIESFLKLDAYFQMLVDQLIGSVSPRTFQGDRVTKAEVDLYANREEEGKDAKIVRFLTQFTDMVGLMIRRLCDADTTDDEAKAFQKDLETFLTREEIDYLSQQPVAGTVMDLTPNQRQMVSAFCAEKRGNPLYNQRAIEVEDTTSRLGAEYVERLILKEGDPAETAEQQRSQLLELTLLSTGQPVPVSPRDNHLMHLDIIMPAAEGLAQEILQGNATTPALEAIITHISEHVNFAMQQGADKEALKPAMDLVKNAGPILAQMKLMDQQAEQLAAGAPGSVPGDEGGALSAPPEGPPQAAPPEGMVI
jgi:hypothetical protein